MLLAKAGKLEPLAGNVAHLQHDHAAGGAAVDLNMPLALGPQHEVEGLAAIGQSLHGIGELGGRRLVKPLLEAEQAVWLRRHAKPVRQARGMHPRAGLSGPGQ